MAKEFSGFDDSSWEGYKRSLREAMELGEELGMGPKMIDRAATFIGEYLSRNAEVDLAENRAIKELWQAADAKEKRAIAGAMVKAAKKG